MANSNYVKKRDKYNDLKSSSYSLIIIGVLGIAFMILNHFRLLPVYLLFEGASGLLFNIVMGGLFLALIIGGILSFYTASKVKDEIADEEQTTEDILEYFKEKYTAESMDEIIAKSDIDTYIDENIQNKNQAQQSYEFDEPDSYFSRIDFIKHEINSKYTNLSPDYVEEMSEQVYESIFE